MDWRKFEAEQQLKEELFCLVKKTIENINEGRQGKPEVLILNTEIDDAVGKIIESWAGACF